VLNNASKIKNKYIKEKQEIKNTWILWHLCERVCAYTFFRNFIHHSYYWHGLTCNRRRGLCASVWQKRERETVYIEGVMGIA
jgi:hypothetical protein